MGQYSLEYFYLECNVKSHCIGVELKQPIRIGNKEYDELYILDVILTDAETLQVIENIRRSVDTNDVKIRVHAYNNDQSPFDAGDITFSLGNIHSVNRRG